VLASKRPLHISLFPPSLPSSLPQNHMLQEQQASLSSTVTALREQTKALEGHVLRRFQQVKGLREALAGREEEVGRLRRVEGRMKVRGREGGRGKKSGKCIFGEVKQIDYPHSISPPSSPPSLPPSAFRK